MNSSPQSSNTLFFYYLHGVRSEDCALRVTLIQTPRHRPNDQLPIAAACMPSLDFNTERLPPKPTTHTLPLPAFARISIAVRQLRTDNHSPGHFMADRIWFLAFQSAGVGQFADLGRCLEIFCRDSELCCSGGGDAEVPGVFAAAFEGAVGPFVSAGGMLVGR